jgi:hypothetical protein
MNNKIFSSLLFCAALVIVSCSKDKSLAPADRSSTLEMAGATQISGVGFYAQAGECDPGLTQSVSYVVKMTGDLEGCLYATIEDYECSPSGTYREEGSEYFVGTYKGEPGTFRTTYKFEAKFEGCAVGGAPLGAEIFGRCQHPIVTGSGDGVFEGVSGQLNFTDDVVEIKFPYRGHLRF